MKHGLLRECLWLVHNNVPVDLAFSLPDVDRTAWAIMFSEFNGNKFNIERMRFEDDK